jgi:hypothetical protein
VGTRGSGVVALHVGVGVYFVARRRRREHEELIRDAVARMCAHLTDLPTELRQLHRDVVDILARQDEGARALDGAAGQVPVPLTSPDDGAVLAAAATVPLARPSGPVRPRGDVAWLVRDRAPRVEDHPQLSRLFTWMHATTVQQIGMARVVLAQAARVWEVDEKGRLRLLAIFEQAAGKAEESRELAASGLVLAGLRQLTRVDLALAENVVRAGQAAWWYSLRMPPKRGRRRMLRWVIWSWLVIGDGSGRSGRALVMPWCGSVVVVEVLVFAECVE